LSQGIAKAYYAFVIYILYGLSYGLYFELCVSSFTLSLVFVLAKPTTFVIYILYGLLYGLYFDLCVSSFTLSLVFILAKPILSSYILYGLLYDLYFD
jgi:hypothetical protein